jgi:serine/threonine protein phosphatase PrpC
MIDRFWRRWCWGGASLQGGRDEQQDRWGVFPVPGLGGLLAVVADGMGGHRDGALAAQAVIDTIEQFLGEHGSDLCQCPWEALATLCERAQLGLTLASAQAHSTLVVLWLRGHQAWWLHVGDSRLYHLRRGRRLLRTRDHSTAFLLAEMGEISETDIAGHPGHNQIYRSLGGETMPRPEIGCGQVDRDDVLMLCSDGLWGSMDESELWEAATAPGSLPATATALAERAVARGGLDADNATVILVRPASRLGSGPVQRLSGWFGRGGHAGYESTA